MVDRVADLVLAAACGPGRAGETHGQSAFYEPMRELFEECWIADILAADFQEVSRTGFGQCQRRAVDLFP